MYNVHVGLDVVIDNVLSFEDKIVLRYTHILYYRYSSEKTKKLLQNGIPVLRGCFFMVGSGCF
jgi:hypothetical protein